MVPNSKAPPGCSGRGLTVSGTPPRNIGLAPSLQEAYLLILFHFFLTMIPSSRFPRWLLTLALPLALAACSKTAEPTPAPAPTTGALEGTVSPAGAVTTVTATAPGGLTFPATPNATTGVFSLANLAPGSYSLSFAPATGYVAPAVRTVAVVAGQTAAVGTVAVVAITTGSIEGTISPANAILTVTATGAGGLTFSATPNASTGTFSFANLAFGPYTLTFAPQSGYLVPNARTITVTAGNTSSTGTVVVAPVPQGTIAGTITPADAVTTVTVSSAAGPVATATPSSTGTFSFAGLAPGSYTVRYTPAASYLEPGAQTATVTAGITTTLPGVTLVAVNVNLTATLNGAQEVPVNGSAATGTFAGTYNRNTRQLTYTVTYQGVAPTSGHIHTGTPGNNGPVVIPFASLASPITGTFTLNADLADRLLNNGTYVNIHSAAFPAGEIRGNIR